MQAPTEKLLIVDRREFTITLLDRPGESARFIKAMEFDCAVGSIDYKTRAGVYLISSKARNPDWRVPDSEWAVAAGLVPGTVVKGGVPENPIRDRWMGFDNPDQGTGIHGTLAEDSIGTRASHGCVRMRPADVIDLYEAVPKLTPLIVL